MTKATKAGKSAAVRKKKRELLAKISQLSERQCAEVLKAIQLVDPEPFSSSSLPPAQRQ